MQHLLQKVCLAGCTVVTVFLVLWVVTLAKTDWKDKMERDVEMHQMIASGGTECNCCVK